MYYRSRPLGRPGIPAWLVALRGAARPIPGSATRGCLTELGQALTAASTSHATARSAGTPGHIRGPYPATVCGRQGA